VDFIPVEFVGESQSSCQRALECHRVWESVVARVVTSSMPVPEIRKMAIKK